MNMIWTLLGNTLLIFALRLIEVSIGTLRTTLVVRGKRVGAAVLGFMEVSIWVIAASQVIGHLDTVWNVVGYSGGYVAGGPVGLGPYGYPHRFYDQRAGAGPKGSPGRLWSHASASPGAIGSGAFD
jgi:hypothetical protein